MKYILVICACFMMVLPAIGQNAREIVREAEERRRGIKSSSGELTMKIIRPKWSREMGMKMWTKGEDYSLILVTSPARDEGTANLKRIKEVWSWVPRIERTIKLPPSMMSQSWMGSDFKNEDLVRENSIITEFSHKILGMEELMDRECYKIELIPNEDAAVVWGKIILWIDTQDYIQLKGEYFDEELYLINTMQTTKIAEFDGRLIASEMEMIPADEEGYKTVMVYHDIKFDVDLPESFFSVQNMKRVR
ncbi:MAG: outer membrane lipoprotein-sorting protein [Bacteroidota bacterium]